MKICDKTPQIASNENLRQSLSVSRLLSKSNRSTPVKHLH
jgi:hypothetical protein